MAEPTNSSVTELISCQGIPESKHLVRFRIAVYVFIVSFLCLVGFVGNAVSIVVLRLEKDKKNTTYWLLQTLAVADTLYLVASVFIFTLRTIAEATDWWPLLSRNYPYVQVYIWPCASVTQTTTVWIIVMITVHRYFAVAYPLQARSSNPVYVKAAAVLVFLASLLFNMTTFFERTVVTCNNNTAIKMTKTAFGLNKTYFVIFHLILHTIFKTVGPMLLLTVLTFHLVKHLNKARKAQKSMSRNAANNNNITYMLIVVVLVFVVCELPDTLWRIIYAVYSYLELTDVHTPPELERFIIYSNITTNALQVLNSAVNFIVYGFTGTQFRNDLRQLCCKQSDQDTDNAHTLPTKATNLLQE